ncbi:MAG: ABC transporter permease subunit [Candidatus Nanopelagicales bacterium]
MRSSLPIARKKLSKGFIVLFLALVSALAVHPAYADSVGDEFKDRISGNVQFEGTPLDGVLIKVSGQGYEAEVVTDAEGKWRVGVPSKGDYQVTLIEDTLPEGIAVLEGGSTQLVTVGPGGRVSKNFFIGEGERITVSLTDQVIARIIYGLNFGLMLALAAIGLSLVFGTTGLSNFAHSEMVTFGAITSLILVNVISMPIWLALPLAVVISGLMGWGLDAGLWTPLRRKGLGLVQLMIVSIGLSLAARYVYQFIIGGGTEQLPGATAPKMQLFGAVVLSCLEIASMAISLVAILNFAYWLIFTKIGKATRAISDNASLAAASGIDVDRVIRIVWILAAALAGLAGILWAYFRPGIKWDMGAQILLLIFAAVTLGGLGTAFGALLGALIVGVLIETSALVIPNDLKYVGALVVLIVILLFRPQGILGKKERIG